MLVGKTGLQVLYNSVEVGNTASLLGGSMGTYILCFITQCPFGPVFKVGYTASLSWESTGG